MFLTVYIAIPLSFEHRKRGHLEVQISYALRVIGGSCSAGTKNTVLRDVTPDSMLEIYCYGGSFCYHLQVFCLEGGGSRFLCNPGKFLLYCLTFPSSN